MTGRSAHSGFFPPEDCDLSRPVFHDAELQAEFDRCGYVVVDLLDDARVAQLYGAYTAAAESAAGVNPPGAYNDTYGEFSIIHSWPDLRRKVFDLSCSVIGPAADQLLVDHVPLYANYVNKPPGSGVVPTHQNFSVVDESRFTSVSVWVALVDCVVANGTLWMGDGSHRDLRGLRGPWSYAAYSEIDDAQLGELLRPVDVRAGQAMILDDAVIHYSPPNSTADRRLAVQFVMIPQEAEPRWCQQVSETGDESGRIAVDVWRIDDTAYFFGMENGVGDPRHGTVIERLELPATQISPETLRSVVNAA